MGNLKQKRKKIILYVLISLLLIITVLALMFNSGITVLEKVSGVIVNPVVKVVNGASSGIGNFFASFSGRMALKEQLAKTEEKLIQLENIQSVADEVRAENEQLRALLNEGAEYPEFEYAYAKVILRSVDDYSATYTIDAGSNDGIKENMVVVALGGLAGKIVKVTDTTSVFLAVIDPRCGVPVLSVESRDMGVVKGVGNAGKIKGDLTMNQLPTNAIIKPGDTVITSGMGEVYPKGIKVGIVTEVSKGSQVNATATVIPMVDFDHLENVLIITNTGE